MSTAANGCRHRIRPWVPGTAVRVNFMYLHKTEKKANGYRKTRCHEVYVTTNVHFNFLISQNNDCTK